MGILQRVRGRGLHCLLLPILTGCGEVEPVPYRTDPVMAVVDPVGVGLRTRGEVIRRWLDARARRVRDRAASDGATEMITVVKGNRSEIEALLRMYALEGTLGASVSVTPDSETAEEEDENGVLAALGSLVRRLEGERASS